MKKCQHCGEEYESNDPRSLYCSKSCKTKSYQARQAIKAKIPSNMKLVGKRIKPNNLNPDYEKIQRKIYFDNQAVDSDERKIHVINSASNETKKKLAEKPKWLAIYGLAGGLAGTLGALVFVKPFIADKKVVGVYLNKEGKQVRQYEPKNIKGWHVVLMLGVLGIVGGALWFSQKLDREVAAIPANEAQIKALKEGIKKRLAQIKCDQASLEILPKYKAA